jgi:maltose O-acetyltransferase
VGQVKRIVDDIFGKIVAVTSMQPKLGTTGRRASLVGTIEDFGHIINPLLGKAKAPFSARLRGRLQLWGSGEIMLGEGVSLNGTVVPIELVTYDLGRIEIVEHSFINYGSSTAPRKIGSYCHLGHHMFVTDNDQHDVVRHWELPPSNPVIVEDNVWIGSKVVILPGVRIGSRRRKRCRQRRHQGYPSAMCCSRKSCARASSPHGARLTHALPDRHLMGGAASISQTKSCSFRSGEPLVASIARVK